MFSDLFEVIKEFFRKLFSSRLTALGALFFCMFLGLVGHLFQLQIVHGEEYLDEYIQITEK